MSPRTFLPAAVLAAALFLAGCVSPSVQSGPPLPDNQAAIAPNTVLTIPPPAELGRSVAVAQSIVIHVRGQSFSFDGQLQVTPDELDLVVLDGMGRRALTLGWKNGKIDAKQAPWLPAFVRPANILADIAIIYWPERSLAAALGGTGATLTATGAGRTISLNGQDIVVVQYSNGAAFNRNATLQNIPFGYDLVISSSELAQ